MLDVADDLLEQVGDVVVVELVDDLAPVAAAGHEPEVAQQPELVRDGRALHPDRERDLVHRGRARVQASEDPQPARRRQRLDAVRGDLREAVVAEQPGDITVTSRWGIATQHYT